MGLDDGVDTSLGKRLVLEGGAVFVGLKDGARDRLLAMKDGCELLGLKSGGMLGLEDGKVLGKSPGTEDGASLSNKLGLEDGTLLARLSSTEDGCELRWLASGVMLGLKDGKVQGMLLGTGDST